MTCAHYIGQAADCMQKRSHKDSSRQSEAVVGDPLALLGNLTAGAFVAGLSDDVHHNIDAPGIGEVDSIAILPKLRCSS